MTERKNSRGYDPPVIYYAEETSLDGLRLNLPVGWEFSIGSGGEYGRYRFIVQELTSIGARILLSYTLNGESISSKVKDIKYGRVCGIVMEDIKFIIERSPGGVSFNMEFPDALRPSDPTPLIPIK